MDFSRVKLVPMTIEYFKMKRAWKYEGIYSFYNAPDEQEGADVCPAEDDGEPEYILDGQEYACLSESGELIGSFNFGASARIPVLEEGAYKEDKLDIGLGMKPELCGKGNGTDYVRRGIRLAGEIYGRTDLRLTVAAFNERAIKVYERAGFRKVKEVTNAYYLNQFFIMFLEQANT